MITEELLGAYIEGNLSDQETTYVEAQLASDPDLQDLADEVYAIADEPAPYELDLDDIDLPTFEVEEASLDCVNIELESEPAEVWADIEEDPAPGDFDPGIDDFDFADDQMI